MKSIPIRKEPNMSLAETVTVPQEQRAAEGPVPIEGAWTVETSGAPEQIPPGAEIAIEVVEDQSLFILNKEPRGPITSLPNGDFEVRYEDSGFWLVQQFRQIGVEAAFMIGVSMPAKTELTAGDDPPITGVWGAEARPPQEPNPEG
jgi:hypothetical protein